MAWRTSVYTHLPRIPCHQVAALQVIYDIMVCAVGEMTATFGVPGVMEHCYFMKVGLDHL